MEVTEEFYMNIDQAISDFSALSLPDRLRLVHALWDSMPADVGISPTSSQQAELDRRCAAHDADPGTSISREELERRLRTSA